MDMSVLIILYFENCLKLSIIIIYSNGLKINLKDF